MRQILSGFFITATAITAATAVPAALAQQDNSALVDTYCLGCHNLDDWAGSLALDTLNPNDPHEDAETWELVLRKLRSGMMPPPGEHRPDDAEVETFASALENQLDNTVTLPVASPALQRLNRSEYRNVIRDLLALEADVTTLLPLDNASEGFDNVASGLGSSPALIQGYISAAQKLSRQAIGDMTEGESVAIYNAPPNLAQDSHVDGLPLGTRGGLNITHYFPLDAEYRFSVRGRTGFGRDSTVAMEVTLDGEPVNVESLRNFTLVVPAGEHTISLALLDNRITAGINDIYSEYSLPGSISGLEITGPYNASSPGMTPSREKIFSCYPDSPDMETACAREILGTLATQAFRMPVSEDGLEPVMTFYHAGAGEGGFETGIQHGLARILSDPRFLFRFEEEPADLAPGTIYDINDLELASRLSFFLWSSIPDQSLIEQAADSNLGNTDVLTDQALRMLQDSKAEALIDNFAGQWLRLRELETLTPETDAFNDNLRQAFIEETRLLMASIIADDLPVTSLLDADFTYLNERLARHYDIEGVYGDYFRRVELPQDSPRRGLLGQGSMLTVTSTATRTSPVIRGSWILENLLHAPVPAPPPGVETNLEADVSVEFISSVRERLEVHRANPSCGGCHGIIDPVGFALENFDMIGAWREKDGDSPVDASGTLVDGTPVSSPSDLRKALLSKPELFVTTFTEKMLTYALGRKLEYYDMPYLRAMVDQAEDRDYRFSAIVESIVTSPLFLQRSAAGSDHTVAGVNTEHGATQP